MATSIVTAFDHFPAEGAIIGRLLAGYGELEFTLGLCLERVLRKEPSPDTRHIGLKALYRLRGETARVYVADALMRDDFVRHGLDGQYGNAIGGIRHCLLIRNQFAHCAWGADRLAGLFFTDLEEQTKSAGDFTFQFVWNHIDLALLQQHEAYFLYTLQYLEFIHGEYRVKAGMARVHDHAMPPAMRPPILHNPPEGHSLRFDNPTW